MVKTSQELESELNGLSRSKETLKKRRDALKAIKTNLSNNLLDELSQVNADRGNAKQSFSYGLKGATGLSVLMDTYDDFIQKSIANDNNLSETLDYINQEISRCESEMATYDSKMADKKQAITQAKEVEKQAASQTTT